MKLSKLFTFALLILTFAGAAREATAQGKGKSVNRKTAAPRTVYDFYLKVPVRYFPFLSRLKDRADFVDSNDEKNSYLRFGANVPFPPEHAEMALLKRMNGSFYIVISYTDDDESGGQGVLRFLEYANGKFSDAQGASPVDLKSAQEIYRRKTGKSAGVTESLIYRIEPVSKTITVEIGGVKIYESAWDGNFYDLTAPVD